jgi:hypothetical protein
MGEYRYRAIRLEDIRYHPVGPLSNLFDRLPADDWTNPHLPVGDLIPDTESASGFRCFTASVSPPITFPFRFALIDSTPGAAEREPDDHRVVVGDPIG